MDAEVIIVGGGVIGCAVAWFLSRAGVCDVVLLERDKLAGGATGLCPGGIRQQFEGDADCRLARRAMRFWESVNRELRPELPFRFERSGYLFLAFSEAALERYRGHVERQHGVGVPSELLEPAGIARRWPALSLDGVRGGTFCGEDGFLEDCHGITVLLAQRARDAGLRVLYEEVLAVERRGAAWCVRTPARAFHAGAVVVAAGTETPALVRSAGVDLPITIERRRLLYTAPHGEMVLPPLVVAPERSVAGKQLTSGGFYLGWLDESSTADDVTFAEKALSAGATLLPLLADIGVRRIVTGWYDVTPDRRPILGPIPGQPNLWLATGFSGHGFMLAPAVGELLAQALVEGAVPAELQPFAVTRFERPTCAEGLSI